MNESTHEPHEATRIQTLRNLGRSLYRQLPRDGVFRPAEGHFANATGDLALRLGDKQVARAAYHLATAYFPSLLAAHEALIEDSRGAALQLALARFTAGVWAIAPGEAALAPDCARLLRESQKDPQSARICHMLATGHTTAATEVLFHYRSEIRGRVLDAGSGPGELAAILASMHRLSLVAAREIVCFDQDEAALDFARRTVSPPEAQLPELHFVHGDLTRLEAQDAYDSAIASQIWPWLEDRLDEVFHGLKRALVPGGSVVCIGEHPDRLTMSPWAAPARFEQPGAGPRLRALELAAERAGLAVADRLVKKIRAPVAADRHELFALLVRNTR